MSGEDRTDLDVAAILGAHTRRFAPGSGRRRDRRRRSGWLLTAVLLAVLATPEAIHLIWRAAPAQHPVPDAVIQASATPPRATRSPSADAAPAVPPTAYVFAPVQTPTHTLRPDTPDQVAATQPTYAGRPRPGRHLGVRLRGRQDFRLARADRGRAYRGPGAPSLTDTLNRTRFGDSGAMSDVTVTDSLNRMEARRAASWSSWGEWRRPAYPDEALPERRQMALRRRIQREQRTEAWDDISLLRQR